LIYVSCFQKIHGSLQGGHIRPDTLDRSLHPSEGRMGNPNTNKGIIILSASTSYIKREIGGDHTTGAFTVKEQDQDWYKIPRNYHLEFKASS
jgi:hypothetical protein